MNQESPRQAEDRRLLAEVARRDTVAFAALYDRLSGPLHTLCLRMVGNPEEAEDVLQEVFLSLWRRAESYDGARSSVFSWAVLITRGKAIDHLRSRGRRLRVVVPAESAPDDEGGHGHGPPEAVDAANTAGQAESRDQAGQVRRVLGQLPADQIQVIEMAFFGDLSHHEISARLGQPLGTIKARIPPGVAQVARWVEEDAMISDEQQDQAALDALGLLDANEAAAFAHAVAADPELGFLAAELREVAASLTFAAAPEETAPPAGLRARLLAEVGRREPVALAASTVAPARRSGWTTWVPWAVAAVVVIFSIQAQNETRQEYNSLLRQHWAEQRNNAENAARLAGLENQRDGLLRRLAVSQMEPTPDGPAQGSVTVVWDPATHRGKLLVTRLRPPGAEHDYQLWAVEEGHPDPVSAGVVHLDAEGRAQAEFRPVDAGNDKVNAFALSLEPAGGSEKARGPILLLGKL